jgi:hypothetical protein
MQMPAAISLVLFVSCKNVADVSEGKHILLVILFSLKDAS